MFLLTEQIPVPSLKDVYYKGLSFWTESQTMRTFFYCACGDSSGNPNKPTFIFRFDIHEPSPQWNFVGRLDFWCDHANVSPCGRYFWSIRVKPNYWQTHSARLEFRQINPTNLQYTKFRVIPEELELGNNGHIDRIFELRHTTHAGTLLIIETRRFSEDLSEHVDLIYQVRVDQELGHVTLEEIRFPELASAGNYPLLEAYFTKITNIGIFENENYLCFYQIDYFGEIFLSEHKQGEVLKPTDKWAKLRIEGDTFEPLVLLANRDFASHPLIDWDKWRNTYIRLGSYRNFSIDGNFLCYGHRKKIHIYRLEFLIHKQVCRSTLLFTTSVYFWVGRDYLSSLPERRGALAPKTLIFYGLEKGTVCTKMKVCKIAPLLHLTYRIVIDLLALREEEAAKTTTSNKSLRNRIFQLICRQISRLKIIGVNSPKHGSRQIHDNYGKKWSVKVESCADPPKITTIMPILHSVEIMKLLQKLNKFD